MVSVQVHISSGYPVGFRLDKRGPGDRISPGARLRRGDAGGSMSEKFGTGNDVHARAESRDTGLVS